MGPIYRHELEKGMGYIHPHNSSLKIVIFNFRHSEFNNVEIKNIYLGISEDNYNVMLLFIFNLKNIV